jgi:5-methylcytosine-specific restriction endonuclease McrA|tara:strand:+ start:262 stop:537 length:276 start_codon:yes stop_codon:yes gene_type:complete
MSRDYKRENKVTKSKPKNIKKRVKRNKARRILERLGFVKKGDGKHVDHKKPLSKGGSNKRNNLRVKDGKKNSSFARNSDGSIKRKKKIKST